MIKILTVTKSGIQSVDLFNPNNDKAVPVGKQAVFYQVGTTAQWDLLVITNVIDGFQELEYWKFPSGSNPENYFTITEVEQNPDGSFKVEDQWKLPQWLYTNGVIDKLGPGLIDPEWWRKNKWWIWAIAGLTAIILLDNGEK